MRTIRETAVGEATVRLLRTSKGYAAAVFAGGARTALEEGDDPDEVWRRAHDAAARLAPGFIGHAGARNRFLSFFPDGFHGAGYVAAERAYKVEAKQKLDAAAPLDRAAAGTGFGEAALAACRATNLLFRIEKSRLEAVLRGPDADSFVQAAAALALGDGKAALPALRAILKPHGSATWTAATYLPFLWRPEAHVFLKPATVRAFAERVGHRFARDYRPELDPRVYEALRNLAGETRARIADLEPRDMIDVQGFIWTVMAYTDEDRREDARIEDEGSAHEQRADA